MLTSMFTSGRDTYGNRLTEITCRSDIIRFAAYATSVSLHFEHFNLQPSLRLSPYVENIARHDACHAG